MGYSEEGESVDEQIAGLAEDLQSTSQPLEQMMIQKRLSRRKIQMWCSIHWG